MQPGFSRDAAIASIPQSKVIRFSPPSPGAGNSWWIVSCRVKQEKAGDHATMQVTYTNNKPFWAFDAAGWSTEDSQATWTLDWEAYVCQPSWFCANPEAAPRHPVTDGTAKENKAKTASYVHIQELMHYQVAKGSKSAGSDDNWQFAYRIPSVDQSAPLSASTFTLNGNERVVWKKMQQQTAAVYHRPVLTYTTVDYYSSMTQLSAMPEYPHSVGNGMDVIEDGLPEGCPYRELDQWQWLKTGDHMDTHFTGSDGKQVKYVRQQVWKGAIEWDINYYGKEVYSSGSPAGKRWLAASL